MTRREMREHTFKLLFCKDFHTYEELSKQAELYVEEYEFDEEVRNAFIERMESMFSHVSELDEKISEVAKGWTTGRMGKAELTVLRLALYEIMYDEDVPDKVAINEAVELAKKFGGDDSPAFVNGVLAKLV
ncbi:MAG: transcription antitermination factor NusB [Lachnospiraceae bacterium]|nr:transcription antitermination factor NusB [Lachnospiraceae bacterium]